VWGKCGGVIVAGGDVGFVIEFGGGVIRIRIPCIVHVSCMYRERILMCPVHILGSDAPNTAR